jgi:SAM-dependent methyltransferase
MRALISAGIHDKRILEIGSLDVNSSEQGLSIRALCDDAAVYVGIDERDGAGVDIVSSAADYIPDALFDIAITTEALEHTPDPESITECAWRSLAPGGLLIVTVAGPGRTPHGCDGGAVGDEYYKNVSAFELRAWLMDWTSVRIEENAAAHDVYCVAMKPKG